MKNKLFKLLLMVLWILFALFIFEFWLRVFFVNWIFNENEIINDSNKNMKHNFEKWSAEDSWKYYEYFWEEIYFWYEDKYKYLHTKSDKKNIAIIWDSVAQWDTGWMSNFKFSKIINDENWKLNILNYSRWWHNISQEYVQYEQFIKENDNIDTVIYIYYNNDLYFSNMINGSIYTSPIIIDNSSWDLVIELIGNEKIDAFLSHFYIYKYIAKKYSLIFKKFVNIKDYRKIYYNNTYGYEDYLINRFLMYVKDINNSCKDSWKKFIILISPTPKLINVNNNFDKYFMQDNRVYKKLKAAWINVYNLYDYDVHKKDYFIDNCCHLNKKWHIYYSNFIKNIVWNQ